MSPLLSFFAASALAALDLAGLAFLAARLGTSPGRGRLALLALGLAFKLALLAAGLRWLAVQPGASRWHLAAGLLAPFAAFILYQALRLQLRQGRRG